MKPKIIDLFAGIGGFSLAAHWSGYETAAFVEWEKYPQKVLKKNFPNVPIFGDIKEFNGTKYTGQIKIVCGGFPCQPFSTAGKRKGATDDRYLWPEMLRVIREVQPAWVIGENVAGLVSMDNGAVLEEVCASLEGEGYEVQPFIIPACAKGAPHRRDRIWIIGYSESNDKQWNRVSSKKHKVKARGSNSDCPTTNPCNILHQGELDEGRSTEKTGRSQGGEPKEGEPNGQRVRTRIGECDKFTSDTNKKRLEGSQFNGTLDKKNRTSKPLRSTPECNQVSWRENWYEAATRLCRVHNGLPGRMDANRANRLKALGNSIVPQVAYELFEAIKNQ